MKKQILALGVFLALFANLVSAADGDFYLSFPLAGYTHATAPISSVFDHSQQKGNVTAYTGEHGDFSTLDKKDRCYSREDGQQFEINRNYVGAVGSGGKFYLCYDGHKGIDYAVPEGTPVYAAADGTVHANEGSKYNAITINHGNGYNTQYLHLSSHAVRDKDKVKRGDLIGYSGDTGAEGAFHLHFAVKKQGIPADPYGWKGSGEDPYKLQNIDLWTPPQLPALFFDDFNDNSINPELWAVYDRYRVAEEEGIMKVETTVTDQHGRLLSQQIPINAHAEIVITRKAKINYGNQYFDGIMQFTIDGLLPFGVSYANYAYSSGNECPTFGFALYRNGVNSHQCPYFADISPRFSGPWGEWFDEKIVYNPATGLMEYFINEEKKAELNVGSMTTEGTMNVYFHPWGWWTGHYQHFDDFKIVQGGV